MATIVTRETGVTAKGSPLTNAELDQNFINLNTTKLELGQAQSSGTANSILFLDSNKNLAQSVLDLRQSGTDIFLRQSTEADGKSFKVQANSLVAAGTNSQAYSYSGGGMIASVTNSDSAVLLDTGRFDSTGGVFKVRTTSASNISLTLSKNGTNYLYVDTTSGSLELNKDLQQSNATYLKSKLYGGTATRLFGLNSSDDLYIGSVDATHNSTLFVRNGVKLFGVDSAGNFSIGNIAGTAKLTVDGVVRSKYGAFGAGGYQIPAYTASADSRGWWMVSDYNNYGDFCIARENSQGSGTYNIPFQISTNGQLSIGCINGAGKINAKGGNIRVVTTLDNLTSGFELYDSEAGGNHIGSITRAGNGINIAAYDDISFKVGAVNAGVSGGQEALSLQTSALYARKPLKLDQGALSHFTKSFTGTVAANTWYDVCFASTVGSGVYIVTVLTDTFNAGGTCYGVVWATVPFGIGTTNTNGQAAQVLPTPYGTGHAVNGSTPPSIKLVEAYNSGGAADGQLRIQVLSPHTLSALDGTVGKSFIVDIKRIA